MVLTVMKILGIIIEPCGEGDHYGFSFRETENEDYRFQLFDGTVVHNSTLTGVLTKGIVDDGRGFARKGVLRHPRKREWQDIVWFNIICAVYTTQAV